jgi:hypothetical protein
MNNIKPTYVSFEQAKLLKEKGFNISLYNFYYQEKSNSSPVLTSGTEYQSDRDCKWDWNLNGGESGNQSSVIPYPNDTKGIYTSAPEQWQVVEWLRLNHGIWVNTIVEDNKWTYGIYKTVNSYGVLSTENLIFNSPQEAYSSAFDYILKELI